MKKSYDKNARKFLPYAFALLFIAGIVLGCMIACSTNNFPGFTTAQTDSVTVFTNSFLSFLKPCLVIWIFGFTGISVYISAFVLAYRGSFLGFMLCMIFKTYGISGGLIKAIAASLPQNFIYLPFLLFLSVRAYAPGRKKPAGYIVTLALSVAVCIFSALIDAFITSRLINFTFR